MNFFLMTSTIMGILIVASCRGNPVKKEIFEPPKTNAIEHSSGKIKILARTNAKENEERQGNARMHLEIFTSLVYYIIWWNVVIFSDYENIRLCRYHAGRVLQSYR